ncbi:class III lanthionine synthetase LanKC N-terminal domain-containing protein [Streptomyces griseus]
MSTDRDEHDGGSFFALDTGLLPGIVEGVLHRRGATQWTVEQGEFWCSVRPRGHRSGEQGWKLHLSATPLSAALVLAVAADVLVEERASFKFAGALDRVALLTGGRADRGGGGKFITVYPDDPELFRRLARRLHAATLGLRGPRILSDRPYAPGSLVHYRYGVFGGVRTTTNDGDTDVRLRNPGGGLEKDRRQAWVTTPAWAPPPFPEPAASPEPTASPETTPGPSQEQEKEKEKEPTGPRKRTPTRTPGRKSVRLNGRYVVAKAIRHAFKGGVYRATDETTGRQVVVKEARAHVGVRMDGTDLQDTLRHEAETLEALAPLGFTPAAIEVFAQGGNLFLAQEFVPGRTLRDRLVEHPVRDLAEFLALGRRDRGHRGGRPRHRAGAARPLAEQPDGHARRPGPAHRRRVPGSRGRPGPPRVTPPADARTRGARPRPGPGSRTRPRPRSWPSRRGACAWCPAGRPARSRWRWRPPTTAVPASGGSVPRHCG